MIVVNKTQDNIHLLKAKVVPLHAMKALGGEEV
jgi:hypothetical protein